MNRDERETHLLAGDFAQDFRFDFWRHSADTASVGHPLASLITPLPMGRCLLGYSSDYAFMRIIPYR